MGWAESASAAFGIKIKLTALVAQLAERNVVFITRLLTDGFIEDENGFYNETYQNIVLGEMPEQCLELQQYLTTQFQQHGDLVKFKFSNEVRPNLWKECLMDKFLLVPLHPILSTERWGYSRGGINGLSCPVMSTNICTEELEEAGLQQWELVFLLKQSGG